MQVEVGVPNADYNIDKYIRYHYRREEPEVVSRSGTGGVVQIQVTMCRYRQYYLMQIRQ